MTKRMRYTRQSIATNTFLQMPRFLYAGEFAGNRITNNARILYTLLLDRHRLSIKNGWFDHNGEAYIYFKREEMEHQLGISERTVSKVMQELKDLSLVEEKKQGLNKPNKIYLLSPIIGDDEDFTKYVDPSPDYNPDDEYSYEPENTAPTEPQNLQPQTRKNYRPEPVNSAGQEPQNLSPSNNNYNNNEWSNNEVNKTATGSGEIPYTQIQNMYNQLCETQGLRPIRSITGNRKAQTAARFKEYELGGFFDLFTKVSASMFLCGGGDRGWKADYDWLITPANMQKVLEGKYDNDQCNIPAYQTYYPQNKNERPDPFLERALTAYATITQHAV